MVSLFATRFSPSISPFDVRSLGSEQTHLPQQLDIEN
jgi:hypothetical protein